MFLRNIYSDADLKKSENIGTLKNYYIAFDYFLHTVVLLNKYNKNSDIEDVDQNVMATFLRRTLNLKYNSFLELHHDIEVFTVKFTDLCRKKELSE